MAGDKFCYSLALAAVLVCLLIGTIACETQGKSEEEMAVEEKKAAEEELKRLLSRPLGSKHARKLLNQQRRDLSILELTVEEVLALSNPSLADCQDSKFDSYKKMKTDVSKDPSDDWPPKPDPDYFGLFEYFEEHLII